MTKVTITASQALTTAQLDKIKQALRPRHGKDIVVETIVDPKIIAGLKVRIGSREVDHTVQGKLQLLRSQLLAHL